MNYQPENLILSIEKLIKKVRVPGILDSFTELKRFQMPVDNRQVNHSGII